ncbi:TetR/AcrR family transcriptional regulator [Streptomyces bambusae]|uniref:TetR/AcrR family transcriptional regulator n=1 Tax=Streptomyces bambusae TaxID=1550616 RepID=UPI001CFFEDE3|nr:TetR/AcrR family transcriptional regulator [Streptomyces bambusae]MCB5169303.1 TetR/AcrR family transcriptional regulator [Streptomyces bambusae]
MTTNVRRRMGVEERRQQLIGVALELFSHRSPDEVSIDEIAAAAGISRPLVYHYFPGKLSLYEAALRRAANDLAGRFDEPHEGPLGARLLRVMGRYFAFVEEHGPGFSALMRGGPAAGSSRTNAMIDEVRHAAYEQILAHLGVGAPPARLELVVRSWVSLAESTALLWLDGRRIPRAELELQLVHDFAALMAVSAAYDPEMGAVVGRMLADEPADGPFGDLVARLIALVPAGVPAAAAEAAGPADGGPGDAGVPQPRR